MTAALKLITKRACPFAQRTLIVLNLLSLKAEIVEIDVYDKPDWFKAISPLGKVPVLRHDGAVLFESTAINEYLVEEFGSDSGLIPATAQERAAMRAWIQFDETALAPAFYRLLLERDPDRQDTKRGIYETRLRALEAHLRGIGERFLLGPEPTLADVTLYTHLTRLGLLQRERGVTVGLGESPLPGWLDAVAALPGVAEASPSTGDLEEDMRPYLSATVRGTTAMDMAGRPVA